MNSTIQDILSRRSIRRFTQEGVSEQDLELILRCGLYAANGGNHQVVRLTAMCDRAKLDELARLARAVLEHSAAPGAQRSRFL